MNQIFAVLIVLMMGFHPYAMGTPFSWADTIGGKGFSHGNSIVADLNNNLYVCGQMNGTFQPGKIKIIGKNNFLIKYNQEGSLLWAKALPGLVCKSVSVDPDGNPCI